MALVRVLYFCAARHNIHVIVTHIDGTTNCIADALSCFQVQRFYKLAPEVAKTPDTIRAWPIQLFSNYQRLGVATSTRQTYQAGIKAPTVLNILSYPSQLHHLPYAISAAIWLTRFPTKPSRYIWLVFALNT